MKNNYLNTLFGEKTKREKDLAIRISSTMLKAAELYFKAVNATQKDIEWETIVQMRTKLLAVGNNISEDISQEEWAERIAETIDIMCSAIELIYKMLGVILSSDVMPRSELQTIVKETLTSMWKVKIIHYDKGEESPTSSGRGPIVFDEDVDMSLADILQEILWLTGNAEREAMDASYSYRDLSRAMGCDPNYPFWPLPSNKKRRLKKLIGPVSKAFKQIKDLSHNRRKKHLKGNK